MQEELSRRIGALEQKFSSLESAERIPLEIDTAFRARLITIPEVKSSTKGATSEDQAVNEAGAAAYNVLKSPDAFLEVRVGMTTYYIPAYT